MSETNGCAVLNEQHMDVLRELGSMGTAHAATTLSNILEKKVTIADIVVSWVDFANVTDFIGGPNNIIASILASLTGNIEGMVVHLLELDSAAIIASALLNEDTKNINLKNQMERSAITEFGNMMISSYLGALAGLIGSRITPSVPSLSIDMANAILSVPVAEFGKMADQVLLIESKLELVVDEKAFSGCFLFAPNLQSLNKLVQALGVEQNVC